MRSRFMGLVFLALALIMGLFAGTGANLSAQAAVTAPAIYLVPHQDDDILSYGADMKNHIINGRRVIAVLLTDGSESGVCYTAYGNGQDITKQRYDGGLSAAARTQCKLARDAEFTKSMNLLGVEPVIRTDRKQDSCSSGYLGTYNGVRFGAERINTCTTSNTMTAAYVHSVVSEYLALYPNASIKGYTYKESLHCDACDNGTTGTGHPDHDRVGEGMVDAYQANETDDVRYMVKSSMWDDFPNLTKAVVRQPVNDALDAYGVDSPNVATLGYGIGQKSSSLFCEQYGLAKSQPGLINNGHRNCTGYEFETTGGADNWVHQPGA